MLTSEFAAELSHLRVPLASIIAHLEILEDELGEEPDAVVADVLARTLRAAERMQRMLEQRLETGRFARDDNLCEVDLLQVAQRRCHFIGERCFDDGDREWRQRIDVGKRSRRGRRDSLATIAGAECNERCKRKVGRSHKSWSSHATASASSCGSIQWPMS